MQTVVAHILSMHYASCTPKNIFGLPYIHSDVCTFLYHNAMHVDPLTIQK
jgi:hypothetical protein